MYEVKEDVKEEIQEKKSIADVILVVLVEVAVVVRVESPPAAYTDRGSSDKSFLALSQDTTTVLGEPAKRMCHTIQQYTRNKTQKPK